MMISEERAIFLFDSIENGNYNKKISYEQAFFYAFNKWNGLLTDEDNLKLFIQHYNLDNLPLYKEIIICLKNELIFLKQSFSLSKIINSITWKKVIKQTISVLFICYFIFLFANNEQFQLFVSLGMLSMFACGIILFLLALLLQMIGVVDYIFKNYPTLIILFSVMFFVVVWIIAILNNFK